MKSFTSLEQSKKLAEILPLESADMCWTSFDEKWDAYLGSPNPDAIKKEIPCWSLAALLDILPCNLKLVLAINDYQGDRKEKYVIGSVEHEKCDCFADNPVDACYGLILKLHELNLL